MNCLVVRKFNGMMPISSTCNLRPLLIALYICHHFQTTDKSDLLSTLLFLEKAPRTSQLVVPNIQFYSSQEGRHDHTMMESSENPDGPCSDRLFPVWFGKAVLPLRINMPQALFAHFSSEDETEFFFLQNYQDS